MVGVARCHQRSSVLNKPQSILHSLKQCSMSFPQVWFVQKTSIQEFHRDRNLYFYMMLIHRGRGLARVIVRDEPNRRNIVASQTEDISQQCQNLHLKLANIMTGAISEAKPL